MISTLKRSPCERKCSIASSERPHLLLEGLVGRDDLRHLLLDGGQVLGRERARHLDVVVEAVLDRRAHAQVGVREQPLDRGGHDVRGGVADGRERRTALGVDLFDDGFRSGRNPGSRAS
jgi:hypothetical protein